MTTRKEVEVQREQYTFAGTGEVYSYTTLQETPEGFDEQAPYMLALVKLDEGPIITQKVISVDHEYSVAGMVKAGNEVEKSVLADALKLVLEDRVFVSRNRTVIFD